MQDDIIFEYFTVKEALTFAARLKLKITKEQQDIRVAQLIKDSCDFIWNSSPEGRQQTK